MRITQSEFERLKKYMHSNFGINLENKMSLVEGRLTTYVERNGFSDFNEFIDYAMKDATGEMSSLLVSKLTTNYTYFMREEQHYKYLTGTILPEWEKKIKDHDLRTWSAGCSSGEEPYTTAMVLADYFASSISSWDLTVLATDISKKVLGIAKKGEYSESSLRGIPAHWQTQYFTRLSNGNYEVTPNMKKRVVFGVLNLMDATFPFKKKFHVIFCRNVMIYFDNKTRQDLANKYYNVLEPGGYLIIGLSETLANVNTYYEQVIPSVYKKVK